VPLDGGITNRNYRVRLGGRDCVVRLPGKDTDLLGIDREAERAATAAAAALGIGPDVVAFEPERGCLVTGFIASRPVPPEELRTRLGEAAAALRAIHAGRRCQLSSRRSNGPRGMPPRRWRAAARCRRSTTSCAATPTGSPPSWAGRRCRATTTC
jgi:hypothetical protein